jgi:hypothetical protein
MRLRCASQAHSLEMGLMDSSVVSGVLPRSASSFARRNLDGGPVIAMSFHPAHASMASMANAIKKRFSSTSHTADNRARFNHLLYRLLVEQTGRSAQNAA